MNSLSSNLPLGKATTYPNTYDPTCLYPIPREFNRAKLALNQHQPLPFKGLDIWNGYEVSWLNNAGKPIVATAVFRVECTTPNIIESKSLKLYLNSFNNSAFDSLEGVQTIMQQDLSAAAGGLVSVELQLLRGLLSVELQIVQETNLVCLDDQDVTCTVYKRCKDFLKTDTESIVTERLYSNLLKANCLVTSQPDWGTFYIEYTGKRINHEGLLQYIVSFRNDDEFAETCAERMYIEIQERCQPELLTIYLRFTRRGGLDINPYRTNNPAFMPTNIKLVRQ